MKECTELQKEKFFKALVKNNDCLEWHNAKMSNGYGQVRIGSRTTKDSKVVLTHRLAYYLANGELNNGLMVLHKCDNRICCNPEHLYQGTAADNSKDMVARNRQVIPDRKGEKNGRAVLNKSIVDEIRKLNLSNAETVRKFNISKSQAHRILTYKQWV
jgi:hypothetical protein